MAISSLPSLKIPSAATQKKPATSTPAKATTSTYNPTFKSYAEAYQAFANGVSSPQTKKAAYDYLLANPQANVPQQTPQTLAPSQTGGGGTAYPDLSGAISILRSNIAGLDPIYASSVENANKSYETSNNERLSRFATTKAQSDDSALSNDQTVLTARNSIGKNTRVSADSIASILGAIGMGGSTTNKALTTIADKSNDDGNVASYAYGKNKQSILQSWNDYVNQDENQQKQLVDKKNYDIAQAEIARATAKKDYLTQIATNEVNGGIGNGSSVLNEIAGLNTDIGNFSKVNTTYDGKTPVYKAPDVGTILGPNLPSYSVAPTGAGNPLAPKIVKVNPQNDGTEDKTKYGITS